MRDNKSFKNRFKAVTENRFLRFMDEKGIFCFIVSFAVPVMIMLFAFAQTGVHPFGDRQILVVDLWHQYFPFFRVEREKLLEGGSFLYSWQNGLGTNFLSLISYYSASPLNWLSVFFDDNHVRDALTYILLAKIGFSGAFFSCFLRYVYKRKDISVCVFSAMFALCSYVLGYYWNVMWFDTVALFPLVMTGVVAICREKKWKLFTFSLALSLVSSYYIGYFTCIFCIFMFAAAGIIEPKGIKDFFVKFLIMVRSSVLGISLSAFMLVPAYLALKLTHSADNTFPKNTEFYEKWTDLFANLLSFSQPTKVEGLPNFACGMLAVFLFGVFLFSFGIKIREKISVLVMLAVIAVSCNMNKLNYIWHGFHFTNQIPYRFAFIFSFVLVACAFRAYDVMIKKNIKIYQLVLSLIAPVAVFYLNYRKSPDDFAFNSTNRAVFITAVAVTLLTAILSAVIRNRKYIIVFLPLLAVAWGAFFMFLTDSDDSLTLGNFTDSEKALPVETSIIITALFFAVFALVKIINIKNPSVRSHVLSIGLACVVGFELVGNALIGVQTVDTSTYSAYPDRNKQVQNLLEYARSNDKKPFYRTEMTATYTLNDSSLYGYYGISQFSSSANVAVTRFMSRLGLYASEAGNRYYYRISTPVVNSLLGIEYIISKKGALRTEEMSLSAVKEENGTYLYENKYPLSLGFMMDEKILEMPDEWSANPFEYQNDIVRLGAGVESGCFTAQPVALADYKNMEVRKNGFGNYRFTRQTDNVGASAVYDYECRDGSYLYGYADSSSCDSLSVRCDGSTVDSDVSIEDYPVVFPMGNGQSGSTETVEIFADSDSSTGNYKLMIYALSMENFEKAYANLADEQLNIKSFGDTEIVGDVDALNDGVMFFSIPYEKGWTVYVDGVKTESTEILNSMLGVRLKKGHHDIRLVYIPDGLVLGIIISSTAVVICGLIIFLDIRRKRKNKNTEKEIENAESESYDGVQRDELPRVSDTEERPDGAGGT